MNTRLYDYERDYAEISRWWRERKWEPIPADCLPKTGLLVEEAGVTYCACWLYFTGTAIAWIEWLVANPSSPLKKRKSALLLVIRELSEMAKRSGARMIFSSLQNKNLVKLYEELEFQVTDKNMTNMIRRVG